MRRNFRHVDMEVEEPEPALPAATPGAGVGLAVDPFFARLPETFSDAIDQIGMGRFQTRLIVMGGMVIYTSSGWLIDAMEVLVVAFIMEDVAVTFNLSSFSKGLVGSASFFGMLFGVMFWSVYADRYGRRSAFVLTLACIFVAGLASSLAPSFVALLLCRTAVGFGVGGNLPVTSALVTEFLPTKDRAKILCYISGAFWGFGLICASLLGLLLYRVLGRGHEESMWRWYLGLSAVPAVIVGFAHRFLPESARYLSVIGRNDEALKVLEEIARINGKSHVLSLDPSERIGDEEAKAQLKPARTFEAPNGYSSVVVVESERSEEAAAVTATKRLNGDAAGESWKRHSKKPIALSKDFFSRVDEAEVSQAGDVRDLFRTPVLRRVTICIWMFWLFVNVSYYGYSFVLPKYFQDMVGDRGDLVYILTAFVGTSFISAAFLAMWLCDQDRLGRVGTLMWSSFATALCMLVQALCRDVAVLFVPLSAVTMLAVAVSACFPAQGLSLTERFSRDSPDAPGRYDLLLLRRGRPSPRFAGKVPGIVKYVVTPELFSTKHRVVGLGSASVWTRIGGVVAPIMAEVLYDKSPALPLAAFCPIMILCGIFAGLIPVETAGRKLDDDSWDNEVPLSVKVTTPVTADVF